MLLKKIYLKKTVIKISDVGQYFLVFQGKEDSRVLVTPEMIGHKFGEYSFTRKRNIFKSKS
jgi:ribosomal protein S19